MLDKTLGIVLSVIPYNDNSQLVHIYTEKYGKITYKVAIRQFRKGGHQRMAYTPMTQLELDVLRSESHEFQQIKEASIISSPLSLGLSDPAKYTQCLYMAELVDGCVREVEQNSRLWSYLYHSLEILSLPEFTSEQFHLLFTVKLFDLLGFGIYPDEYEKGMQFDMRESRFTFEPIFHPYYLNKISAEYLYNLISKDFTDINELKLNNEERKTMLEILLAYLKLHMPEIDADKFGILKDIL